MPKYATVNIDVRGPEPVIRLRAKVEDENQLVSYKLTRQDIDRITGFVLETLALKFFGSEDLAWILSDINDHIKEPHEYQVGDTVLVPTNWDKIARAARASQTPGRERVV